MNGREKAMAEYKQKNNLGKNDNPYPYPPTHFLINGEMVPSNKAKRIGGKLVKMKEKYL